MLVENININSGPSVIFPLYYNILSKLTVLSVDSKLLWMTSYL